MAKTPEEVKAYQAEYRRTHKAERKAYAEAHKEELAAKAKAYREAHGEKMKAQKEAWAKANREQYLAKKREWRIKNAQAVKQYYIDNKEHIREVQAKYTAEHFVPMGHIKGSMMKDGSFIRTRSLSEAYLQAELDSNNVTFISEVPLETPMGTYIADIFLPDMGIFIEVKGEYYIREEQNAKIDYLRSHGYVIVVVPSTVVDEAFGV